MNVWGIWIVSLFIGMWGGLMVSFILLQKHERQNLELMEKTYKVMESISTQNKQNQSNITYLNHRISRIECLMTWAREKSDD